MKKYNFVIDIGNTNIVFGLYEDNNQKYLWRCETEKSQDHKFYYRNILDQAITLGFDLNNIAKIAVSSVVPSLKDTFTKLVKTKFKCPFIFVDAYTNLGLSFPMPDPGFVGSDLIVCAFSALQEHHTNCLICDFGTATTFQLVGSDGFFFGSAIAPGVHTSANGLFQKASQLFKIDLSTPANLLGTSTRDSLLSGIINGNFFMLEGFIRAIKNEYRHLPGILTIATGGIAGLICKNSKEIDLIDPNLMLDGLNLICDKMEDNA
ncbi:MAG: type III pantothenate kinase [Candidatus Cloacimonetes bacterium]|nr:type III pantothenate kinase [Candidatus Cloacimonadota bacterium]